MWDSESSTAESRKPRSRSLLWTFLLIPFVFLPYRWLWLPCALGATALLWPSRCEKTGGLRRDGTLIVGSVLVLILRTALDPAWWLPWIVVMAMLYVVRCRTRWTATRAAYVIPFAWLAAMILLWRPSLDILIAHSGGEVGSEAVLACAGDSLTSGLSTRSDDDTYVARLRERFPCAVLNAGVAANRAADLYERLDKTVLSRKPSVVLVFIGGNDYLDGTPRSVFAEQLDRVVAKVAASGVRIVLVEVPTGIVVDPYAGVYRSVAKRYGAILVPETQLRLLFTVELLFRSRLREPMTIDGIHLSRAGAAKVADWLEPYLRRALRSLNPDP